MDQRIITPQQPISTKTNSAKKMKMLATDGRQKKASVQSRHFSRQVALLGGGTATRSFLVSVVSATGTATLRSRKARSHSPCFPSDFMFRATSARTAAWVLFDGWGSGGVLKEGHTVAWR